MREYMIYELSSFEVIGINKLYAEEVDTINSGDFGIRVIPLEMWEEFKKEVVA